MSPTDSTRVIQQNSSTQAKQAASIPEATRAPQNACPECSGNLQENNSTGEIHCEDCGIIIEEDTLDRGPEWRNFNDDTSNKSRVGGPLTETLHDRGLSTEIGWQDKDGYGNPLSQKQKHKMSRLRTWNRRFKTKDHKERDIRKGLSEILRMNSALGLPESVSETAAMIFRRTSKEDLLRGYSIEGIATAAVYIAARQEQIGRTFDEMETVSRVSRKRIRRAQSHLRQELNIALKPATPNTYIPRFASRLDVSAETTSEAKRLANHFSKSHHFSGRRPSAVAAAALYTACLKRDSDLTQKDIGEACSTSPVTIRDTYKLVIKTDPDNDLSTEDLEGLNSTEVAEKLKQ